MYYDTGRFNDMYNLAKNPKQPFVYADFS